jgi:hypothetical protein
VGDDSFLDTILADVEGLLQSTSDFKNRSKSSLMVTSCS